MNKRMKWDAEAAFKSLNAQGKRRQASIDDERLKTTPYTPPPAVAAWLRAQADKPKGRDIESLMRYHEAHKKGRTDDDCLAEKFGSGGVGAGARPATVSSVQQIPAESPAASTPPQSADGGQPLPSASTKPHGKDVDTADGPWPKCTKMAHSQEYHLWRTETEGIWFNSAGLKGVCGTPSFTRAMTEYNRIEVSRAEMAGFLEAHGHKDVAAQLRGKATAGAEEFEPLETKVRIGDRITARLDSGDTGGVGAFTVARINEHGVFGPDTNPYLTSQDYLDAGKRRILKRPVADNAIPRADVATGGGRVWEDGGFAWVQIGGVLYSRAPVGRFVKSVSGRMSCYMMPEWEKFGPERDAIVAECRKAMGL